MADKKINYDLKNVINLSIQQTLSRSILTSATTFVMVLFLYILGVESMRAFALPLAVGIIAGTFSSVFISGSLYFIMTKKSERYDEKGAQRAAKALAAADASTKVALPVDEAVEVDEVDSEVEENVAAPVKITANPNRKKKKKRKQ